MATSVQNLLLKTIFSKNNDFFVLSTLFALKNQVHGVGHRALSNLSFSLKQPCSTQKNVRPKEKERGITGINKMELGQINNKLDAKPQPTIEYLFSSQTNKTKSIKNSDVNKKSIPFKRQSGFDIPEEEDPDHDNWAEKIVQFYTKMQTHNAAVDAKEAGKKQLPK